MISKTIIHLVWITFIIMATPCFGDDSKLRLSPEEKSWINENHTVRVRIGNAPPFMLTDGKIQGIAIDYLAHIFNRNGIKFQYIAESEVTWPQALKYIEEHKVVDMVPTAKITDERKKHMIFTDEYIIAPWVIFTRSHADFVSSMEDLKGKTVSVEEGYVIHEKLKRDYPKIKLKVVSAKLKDYAQIPLRDLSTGLVDAYIGNLLSTTYTIRSKGYTNVKVAAPTPFDNHNQAMAIRNDWPELVGIINKTLAAMTPDEHAAIRNRWLTIRYEHGIRKTDLLKWILGVSGIAAVFVLFFLFWNKRLKAEVASRKQIEDYLRDNEQRYKKAQLMGHVGNWEYELAAENFWGSDEAKRIYGLDPESKNFTTEEVENCIPERERVHQALVDLIEKDMPYNLEFEIHPISGPDRKIIKSIAEVIRDASGAPIKIVGVVQDITTQKKAQKAMVDLERQLRQSHKMEAVGTLAGGIAHDFNNILGIILGNAELAMDDVPDWNPARASLEEIKTASLRAKDVVRQLLSFSRKTELYRKPIRVGRIIEESVKLLRASIPTTIEIRVNIPRDIGAIKADPTQIHQILINLCTNAAHAMEENGGILEISLDQIVLAEKDILIGRELKPGPHVRITVKDTGQGMEKDVAERVFEPYFTTKDVGKGTGMGLAVVHGIVRGHKGSIWVKSERGEGTTFTLLFPMVEMENVEKPERAEKTPGGKERILFVDDEGSMVKLNQQRLEKLGYRVIPKTDPSEALEFFRAGPDRIDLVITDMTMPKMTGDKLARAILEIRPDTPIILCTGYSKKISLDSAQKIGIRKYIEKPIEMANLARSVREVLDEK